MAARQTRVAIVISEFIANFAVSIPGGEGTYIFFRKRLACSLSMNLDNSTALRNNDRLLPLVCIYALMCQYTAKA